MPTAEEEGLQYALEGPLGRLLSRGGLRHRTSDAEKRLAVVGAEPAHELGHLHPPWLRGIEDLGAIGALRLSRRGLTKSLGSLGHGGAPYTRP